MDFPRFDGKNARGWVNKADKFFMLNPSIDTFTKVIYAALYLEGEADFWYQTVQVENQRLSWEIFLELVMKRFSTGNQENLIGKFNKLVQGGKVDEYIVQFEELRGYMMSKYPLHSEDFYLSSFLSGLRSDIQQALYIYKPTTLQDAIDKAREQEIYVEMIEKRVKGSYKAPYTFQHTPKTNTEGQATKTWASSNQFSSFPDKGINKASHQPGKAPTIRRISPAEMAKRRERGLCYNCDDVYTPGHKCAKLQLFLMVGEDNETAMDSEMTCYNQEGENVHDTVGEPEAFGISIHAVQGTQGLNTLKVQGMVKGKSVQILIDTGTTHNFLDQAIVKSQGLRTNQCSTLKVQLADGSVSYCSNKVEGLKWKMANTTFESNFYSIPLGGYDAKLGVQWLKQVSPVSFDFGKQEIIINWQHSKVHLKQ